MRTKGTVEEMLADLAARNEAARDERAKLPYWQKLEIVERLNRELEPFRRAREQRLKTLKPDV